MKYSTRKLGDQQPLQQYPQNPTFKSDGYQHKIGNDVNTPLCFQTGMPKHIEHQRNIVYLLIEFSKHKNTKQ
jgi:hypothetical protein